MRSQLKDLSGAKKDLGEARKYLSDKGEKDADIEKEMGIFLYKEGKYSQGMEALRNAEMLNKKKGRNKFNKLVNSSKLELLDELFNYSS